MFGIGKEVDTIKKAYEGNPQALQQKIMEAQGGKTPIAEQTMMAMAMNMLNQEAKAKANQLAQQGGGPAGTVFEQVQQEGVQRKQQELAQTVGQTMQRENQQTQQRAQQMASQGQRPAPQGIATAVQQRPTQMAAQGGLMKAYRGGGQVKRFVGGGAVKVEDLDQYQAREYRKLVKEGMPEEQALQEASANSPLTPTDRVPSFTEVLPGAAKKALAVAGTGPAMIGDAIGVTEKPMTRQMYDWAGISEPEEEQPKATAEQTTAKGPYTTPPSPLQLPPLKEGIASEAKTNTPLVDAVGAGGGQSGKVRNKEILKNIQGIKGLGDNLKLRDAMTNDQALTNAEAIAQGSYGDSLSRDEMIAKRDTEVTTQRTNLGVDERRRKHEKRLADLEAVYSKQEDPQSQAMDRLISSLTAMSGGSSLAAGMSSGAIASLKMSAQQQKQSRENAKDLWQTMTNGENDISALETKALDLGNSLYKELSATQRARGQSKTAATNMQLQNDNINRRTEFDAEKSKLEMQAKGMGQEFRYLLQEAGFRDAKSLRAGLATKEGLWKAGELMLQIEKMKADLFTSLTEDPQLKRALRSEDPEISGKAIESLKAQMKAAGESAKFDMMMQFIAEAVEALDGDASMIKREYGEKPQGTKMDVSALEKQVQSYLNNQG